MFLPNAQECHEIPTRILFHAHPFWDPFGTPFFLCAFRTLPDGVRTDKGLFLFCYNVFFSSSLIYNLQ